VTVTYSKSPSLDRTGTNAMAACRCPVCSCTLAVPFFDGGLQPLATLGWPLSAEDARTMPRYPHDFVQCPACTHVWNRSFRYDAVPYKTNRNRMFNRGNYWKGYLSVVRDGLIARLPAAPVVVEIGCGDGHFVRALSDARVGKGRFVGFDPNTSPETGAGVEFYSRLFEPLTDMIVYRPDCVVVRHVLEHLEDPAELLDSLAWGAVLLDKPCYLYAEAPCIDKVFETYRLSDFYFEHASHFTTRSFRKLMERAGEVAKLDHGYDGEVVWAMVRLLVPQPYQRQAEATEIFAARAPANRANIAAQLDQLASSGKFVVIWGGTGKAAAFIHQFGADAKRFPLVVDSDPDKVGSFVPGTGQEIAFRDVLKNISVDVIIIPMQWRVRDIVAEMRREGITARQILIEHMGALVDLKILTDSKAP